ncbi:MAG: SxtJ family membrane protein [Gemmatimonadaceae bacterium]
MTRDYTPRQGRRFAFTLAIAFAVLAMISFWRGREAPSAILGATGVLLVFGGLLVPGRLGPLDRGWMKLAHTISSVTTPVFLGIVYFGVLTPLGLVRRAMGRNALVRKPGLQGYWIARSALDDDAARARMERQF